MKKYCLSIIKTILLEKWLHDKNIFFAGSFIYYKIEDFTPLALRLFVKKQLPKPIKTLNKLAYK